MIKNYIKTTICAVLFSISVKAQTPCAGTPGANTVLPMSHTICQGAAAHMNLANTYTTTGITIQWQSSNVSAVGPFSNIPGANGTFFISGPLSSNMYYNVVITCTNGASVLNVPHTVTVVACNGPTTGINLPGVTESLVSVFPNPSNEVINITLKGDSPAQATITDMTGRIVHSQFISGPSATINIKDLPMGMYFIQISNANYSRTLKVLKE